MLVRGSPLGRTCLRGGHTSQVRGTERTESVLERKLSRDKDHRMSERPVSLGKRKEARAAKQSEVRVESQSERHWRHSVQGLWGRLGARILLSLLETVQVSNV